MMMEFPPDCNPAALAAPFFQLMPPSVLTANYNNNSNSAPKLSAPRGGSYTSDLLEVVNTNMPPPLPGGGGGLWPTAAGGNAYAPFPQPHHPGNVPFWLLLLRLPLQKDEKLCDYYRRMPVLYDKSHPHYKFQSKKEKAWRELSRLCEMDVEQCKKRMTYFRCRFTVERRIMKNGVNCSEWPLLDKLKFLNKHIKLRRPRATNGEQEETDDESNPMNILRKRQREQQEDVKDDLHAYLDLQQMAAAAAASQNPQAQLHYQQQLKMQGHPQFAPHPQAGYPPTPDMQMHHLPPPPHPQHPGHREQQQQQQQHQIVPPQQQQQQQQVPPPHTPLGHGYRGGPPPPQQPTPVESPIPASNVEVSYHVPKRSRNHHNGSYADADETSLSNYNLNRTVKYQNNLDHSANLDEHGAYGLYVGEVLRKLPERISSLTSLKIMQLLYEAQVQSFDVVTAGSKKEDGGTPNGTEGRKSTESAESSKD